MPVTSPVVSNPDAHPPVLDVAAIQISGVKFQINNAKLYVSVATLPNNDNIKFLENIKQGLKQI